MNTEDQFEKRLRRQPVVQSAAQNVTPVSGEVRKLLRQQEPLFAELAGPCPKPSLPSPRSQRHEDFANA